MWTNWSGALVCRPRAIHRPLDESGVVDAVRRAAERGRQVRPVGAGHSWAPLAVTEDVMVDCTALTGVVLTGPERVRVRAGATVAQVHAALAVRGRALATVPDGATTTVAGAISTGTHGGSSGSLSAQVIGMRLVDGRGTIREVAADDLDAARTALGMLGVVTEVELATVPLDTLHLHEEPGDLQTALAVGGPLDTHRWAEIELDLPAGTALTRWADPEPVDAGTDEGAADGPGAARRDSARAAARRGGSVEALGRTVSRLTHRVARPVVGHPYELVVDRRATRYEAIAWAVPRPAVGAAVRELRAAAAAAGIETRGRAVVRVGPAESGWLHPAHDRPSAWVVLRVPRGTDPAPLAGLAGAVFTAAAGRPHWAAHHEWTHTDVALAYPRLDEFRAVRDRYDPDRRFANPYLDGLLGP